jgi:hypothetical protein
VLAREKWDCAERGYRLIPVWLQQMAGGDYESGYETAAEAARAGTSLAMPISFGSPSMSKPVLL